jgi:hypothetical protein
LSLSFQKYGFGIRDPEKTYSGSRIQGSKRHRIRNTTVQKMPVLFLKLPYVAEDLVPAAGPEVANLTDELAARTLPQDVPNDLRLSLL